MNLITANEATLIQRAVIQRALAVAACEDAIAELLREAQERPELLPLAERLRDLACAAAAMR